MWGGMSRVERLSLPRVLRVPRHAACGTTGGYAAHRRRCEEPCSACREANAAYQRGRKHGETVAQREERNARKRAARRNQALEATA